MGKSVARQNSILALRLSYPIMMVAGKMPPGPIPYFLIHPSSFWGPDAEISGR